MKKLTELYLPFSRNSKLLTLLLAVCALSLSPIVSAHETGASFEAIENVYKLDVGYTGDLIAREAVLFDFNLLKVASGTDVSFDNVWVRLGTDKDVYLSGRLPGNVLDKTILTIVLPILETINCSYDS